MLKRIIKNNLAWTKLEPRDLFVIRLVLAIGAAIRGWDLVFPDAQSILYKVVGGPIPDAVWGWGFLGAAAILLWGISTRWHLLVWLGHGLLSTMYLSLMISLSTFAIVNDTLRFHEYMRYLGVFLPMIVIHGILWMRTGASPPPEATSEAHGEA